MNAHKSECIDNFYSISELLDDNLRYVALFIKQYSSTNKSMKQLNRICVNADYCKINDEIEEVLELSITVYKGFLDKMVFLDECKECGIIET